MSMNFPRTPRGLRLPRLSAEVWVLLCFLVGAAPWIVLGLLAIWPDLLP